jgi:hypothetical protein
MTKNHSESISEATPEMRGNGDKRGSFPRSLIRIRGTARKCPQQNGNRRNDHPRVAWVRSRAARAAAYAAWAYPYPRTDGSYCTLLCYQIPCRRCRRLTVATIPQGRRLDHHPLCATCGANRTKTKETPQ